MRVVSTENSPHYIWGNDCDGWHLAKSGNLSVIQERVPPGCSEVRHYHERAEQFFYILSGLAHIEIEGSANVVAPGQGIHIPAGAKHRVSNQQQEDLTFVVVSTPPSHGDRVNV